MRVWPKVSFMVVAQYHYPNGKEVRLIELYGLSPEEQRDTLNKSLVGYDPTHPDSPEAPEYKFTLPGDL